MQSRQEGSLCVFLCVWWASRVLAKRAARRRSKNEFMFTLGPMRVNVSGSQRDILSSFFLRLVNFDIFGSASKIKKKMKKIELNSLNDFHISSARSFSPIFQPNSNIFIERILGIVCCAFPRPARQWNSPNSYAANLWTSFAIHAAVPFAPLTESAVASKISISSVERSDRGWPRESNLLKSLRMWYNVACRWAYAHCVQGSRTRAHLESETQEKSSTTLHHTRNAFGDRLQTQFVRFVLCYLTKRFWIVVVRPETEIAVNTCKSSCLLRVEIWWCQSYQICSKCRDLSNPPGGW